MKRFVVIAGAALVMAASSAVAQRSVAVLGPSDPIADGVATFSIVTSGFAANELPLRYGLQLSTTPDFGGILFADTTSTSPNITIPRLLPTHSTLYWRAFALTALQGSFPSPVTGPRTTPSEHLRLITPNNPGGQSLRTRTPMFVWSASHIPAPVEQWAFELRLTETSSGHLVRTATTTDTTFRFVDPLESNQSYRWSVIARRRGQGDSIQVVSLGTFVVTPTDEPAATVMFDPFPSPFPHLGATRACIWFDLATSGTVLLDIVDQRGLLVRHLVPVAGLSSTFSPGRYGRPTPDATSGCDDRFSWDGTDANNRPVANGVYLILLRANGQTLRKRVVLQR